MNHMDRDLLARYLSGELTSGERERVEAWLAEDPERWARLAALGDTFADAALSGPALERAKADVWARLSAEVPDAAQMTGPRARRGGRTQPREFAPASRRPRLTTTQLVAALVLALVGGSALGVMLLPWRPSAPAEAERVSTTLPGQRAVFRLPDGTRVMLGVASELRYPADFAGRARQVSLKGEAYFEVTTDERRPFVVRAGDLIAKDLGTEFTVRAYPEDEGARVVVREGRVAIRAAAPRSGAPERVVAPGQLGHLSGAGEPTVEPADTAALFAWIEGRLVFANTPLREAVQQIERVRDLEIHLSPPEIGERRFTTSFGEESASAILQVIGTGLGLEVVQTDSRNYTLHPK